MFRKCKFCIEFVNMSLTSTVDLKVIPLFVNKKGKARVKVHLSQTDYPKVTQVSGMFYTKQAHIRAPSVTLLAAALQTQIYFGVKSFFAYVNVIRRQCSHAVFVFVFSRWFEISGGNQVQQVYLH